MPTIYKAVIRETFEYTVTVTANSEASAKSKAKAKLKSMPPKLREPVSTSVVELKSISTTAVEEGYRVKHFKFGEGIVKSLKNVVGSKEVLRQFAEIEFESGEVKSIVLPLDNERFQILEEN